MNFTFQLGDIFYKKINKRMRGNINEEKVFENSNIYSCNCISYYRNYNITYKTDV